MLSRSAHAAPCGPTLSSGSRPSVSASTPPSLGTWSPRCRCRLFSWTGLSPSCAPVSACSRFAIWLFRGPCLGLSIFDSWRCSLPRWRPWRTWLRMACSLFWRRPRARRANLSRGARPACLALAASLPLALSRTQGCSQSTLRLHSAQSAWPHWPGCQELPPSSARAVGLLPSPLRLPGICYQPLLGLRARRAWPALPFFPSLVPQLRTPVRLPPRWLVRGVPQAPLRQGGAAAISAVGTRVCVARNLASSSRLPRLLRRHLVR